MKRFRVDVGSIVIRMCIALAYPPSSFEENRGRFQLIKESVRPRYQPKRIVHFDFDPKNSRLLYYSKSWG